MVVVLVALRGLAPLVARTVQPADAGEFQLVTRYLGVAHPPGYALYSLTSHLFGRLVTWPPLARLLGAPAALETSTCCADGWTWASGLFSALLAVLTLVVVFRLARRLTGSRLAAALGALTLGLTPTFLAQATTPNIRMATALLFVLLLELAERWLARTASGDAADRAWVASGRRSARGLLLALALAYGLAAGHHGSLAVLGPLLVALVLLRRPAVLRDGRLLLGLAAALLLSMLPLAYLPLRDRAGAVLAEGNLQTLAGVMTHVSGIAFRGDLQLPTDVAGWADRLRIGANLLELQLGWSVLVGAAAGAVWLVRRRPLTAVLIAGSGALIGTLALVYRAPQTVEYLLPTYAALALLAAAAAGGLIAAWPRRGRLLIAAAAVLLVGTRVGLPGAVRAAQPAITWPAVLLDNCLPRETAVLATWHHATPLYYARRAFGDGALDVRYVFPEGAEPIGETWRRRLAAIDGPAVLTARPREITAPLWPLVGTPFFTSQPTGCRPAGWQTRTVGATFGGQVRLRSVTRQAAAPDAERVAPPTLYLDFAPAPVVSERLTIVAQLIGPDGQVYGQVDRGHGAERWRDPRGLVERVTLTPFRDTPPAPLLAVVGIYRSTDGGTERLPVGDGAFDALDAVPVAEITPGATTTDLTARGVPFGTAMTLRDVTVDRTVDELVVDLTWVAGTAYRSDYTVSVKAQGAGWRAQHDGTPAQGALPTLKWLPGMRVHDRHRLALPPEATPADGRPPTVTVSVYDAFTHIPLPVTDGALVRRGQGQAVEVYPADPTR